MYKICIAGSREFTDYYLVEKTLKEFAEKYLTEEMDISIISGTAIGADSIGEDVAEAYNLPIIKFPANWKKYGKSAGYIRNEEMAKEADAVLIFWNGISPGSKHMIDTCKKNKVLTWVIRPIVEVYNE